MNNIPPKDPEAVLPYLVDWRKYLDADELINEATITVSRTALTINPDAEKHQTTYADGKVIFWLGGGVSGNTYTVSCRVKTSKGRTDKRSFRLEVSAR